LDETFNIEKLFS